MRFIMPALGAAALLPGCGGSNDSASSRQASVRELGQQVMSFRLDRTTHIFDKTATGGIESVVAKTAADGAQVPLIRGHLRKEQRLFSRGDLRDPMATHGMRMPGIDVLRRNAVRIDIVYQDIARGARLRYLTADPLVQAALHQWFDAQLMDHGADAMP
jgi:hypothetical protein